MGPWGRESPIYVLLLSTFQNSQEGATTSGLTYLGTHLQQEPWSALAQVPESLPWKTWTL